MNYEKVMHQSLFDSQSCHIIIAAELKFGKQTTFWRFLAKNIRHVTAHVHVISIIFRTNTNSKIQNSPR